MAEERKFKPLIPWVGMYEGKTKSGSPYFSGFLGKLKLMMFLDKNPTGKTTWTLYLQEQEPKSDQGQGPVQGYGQQGQGSQGQQRGFDDDRPF
ncbi:MAG: hypothetical protein HQL90_11335 [Magnetococcales bacterium]|nr:hypothetical protein [Magnetococcales bacterium]